MMKIIDEKSLKALNKAKIRLKKIYKKVLFVVIITGILKFYVSPKYYSLILTHIPLLDIFIFSSIGSIAMGNPSTSYIISNALLGKIPLYVIGSFLIAWVLVGINTLPIESEELGKNFAIARNLVGFMFSILAGIILLMFSH